MLDETTGLPSRLVYAVAATDDGAIWAGTAAGAVRLMDGAIQRYTRANGATGHDWVTALLPDGDAVLAGTYDAGVWRLTPSGEGTRVTAFGHAWINPNGLTRVGATIYAATLGEGLLTSSGERLERLPGDDVTAVARLAGKLWIGTRSGLAVRAR